MSGIEGEVDFVEQGLLRIVTELELLDFERGHCLGI